MTIRNFFAVGSSFTGKVIIQDDEGKGYIEYKRYEDIAEMYLESYVLDWDVLFADEAILITADITL